MTYGYERSMSIEHTDFHRKRINCKDCIYFETDDNTCSKRPLRFPNDSWGSWKSCPYFELDSEVNNFSDKKKQFDSIASSREVLSLNPKPHSKEKVENRIRKCNKRPHLDKYELCLVPVLPFEANHAVKPIKLKASNGEEIVFIVSFDQDTHKAYVTDVAYTKAELALLKKKFNLNFQKF